MDSFPVRRPTLEPQLLSALASLLGLAPPAKDLAIRGVATLADAIYVLHAFEKKSQKTTKHDLEIGRERFRAIGKLRQEHGKAKRR